MQEESSEIAHRYASFTRCGGLDTGERLLEPRMSKLEARSLGDLGDLNGDEIFGSSCSCFRLNMFTGAGVHLLYYPLRVSRLDGEGVLSVPSQQ